VFSLTGRKKLSETSRTAGLQPCKGCMCTVIKPTRVLMRNCLVQQRPASERWDRGSCARDRTGSGVESAAEWAQQQEAVSLSQAEAERQQKAARAIYGEPFEKQVAAGAGPVHGPAPA
jgi:hypothetical protein